MNWQAHFHLGLADFFDDRSDFRAAERLGTDFAHESQE